MGYPAVYKMLLTGPASRAENVHKIIVREGQRPPETLEPDPAADADEDAGEIKRERLGEDTFPLPEGEITAEHFVLVDGDQRTEVWLNDKVKPMGLVRMVSPQGELVLKRFGRGGPDAQSAINLMPRRWTAARRTAFRSEGQREQWRQAELWWEKGQTMRHLVTMVAVALVLAACFAGCRTGREEEPIEPRIAAGQEVAFVPSAALSPLHFEQGDYPTLFAGTSYTVWQGSGVASVAHADTPEAAEATAAAVAALGDNFVVFECHLESVFADMSIAYDVVGPARHPGLHRGPRKAKPSLRCKPSWGPACAKRSRARLGASPAPASSSSLATSCVSTSPPPAPRPVRSASCWMATTRPSTSSGILASPRSIEKPPVSQREPVQDLKEGYQHAKKKAKEISHTVRLSFTRTRN